MNLSQDQVTTPAPTSLASYLRRRVPACSPTGQPVVDITELSAGVWAVTLEGGSRVVAKHQPFGAFAQGRPDDLLVVEPKVLGILVSRSCPVARPLGVDLETRFIFFEHTGDQTLDDIAQEGGGTGADLSRDLISGFCRIERALSERRGDLLPHVSPVASRERLLDTAARSDPQAREGLARLLLHCQAPRAAERTLRAELDVICARLSAREPSLASTDYNARNVVVDSATGRVSFIEFAKIGWDWPERRLVQYATSLGAGRPDGGFVGLLDRQSTRQYGTGAEGDDLAFALDGHHILFHLHAAAMVHRALQQPARPRHRALLDAWQRPWQRLRQLAVALAAPLTDDTRTRSFRLLFSEAVNPFLRGEHR